MVPVEAATAFVWKVCQPTWPIISSINILLLNLRPGALQTIHDLYWGSHGISKTDAFTNLFALCMGPIRHFLRPDN